MWPRVPLVVCCAITLWGSTQTSKAFSQDAGFSKELDREVLGQGSYSKIKVSDTELLGFGVQLSGGLFITQKVCITVGYFSMADATGSTVLNGFNAGAKWYLFSPGSSTRTQGEGKILVSHSEFTHFIAVGYRIRTLAVVVNSPQYSGFSFGYGLNWFFGRTFNTPIVNNIFLNLGYEKANLSNPLGETSKTSNLSLGLGLTL